MMMSFIKTSIFLFLTFQTQRNASTSKITEIVQFGSDFNRIITFEIEKP